MIKPTDQEPAQEVKHIWWDLCNCESWLDEAAKIDDNEDLPKKRKSSQQKLKRRYEKGDPIVGLLRESLRKFDNYVLYPKAEPSQQPSPPHKTLPSPPHKTPPSPLKPLPTSPPRPKLSPYNQKALSILHQDSSSENAVAHNKVLMKFSHNKPQNPQFIDPVIKPQKDYEEFNNVESLEHLFMAESENAESTVQFDAKEYKEHQENLNQETPTEFPKSDIKQYFTFDDVPPSKWREISIETLTWCTAELQYYTIDVVIKRF
ncbi:hypothetical protein Tco_0590460 [Tanacetum coccineum]